MTRARSIRNRLAGIALGLIAASVYGAAPVAERVQYWRAELPRVVPVGSSASALIVWLRAQHMKYDGDASSPFIHFILEEVPGDGVACKSWEVMATASLNGAARVAAYDVDSAGSCTGQPPPRQGSSS